MAGRSAGIPAPVTRTATSATPPFAALATAPSLARGHVRATLAEWGLGELAEAAELIASEMTANARAGMTRAHLCEHERWPNGGRKPSVFMLVMLARMYETDPLCLLDLADHERLDPKDRLTLIRPSQRPRAAGPFGEKMITLMDQRGLSLREVARRLPCSPAHLSKLAHGGSGASEQLAARLDEVLGAGGDLAALAGPGGPQGQVRGTSRPPRPRGRAWPVPVTALRSRPTAHRDIRPGRRRRTS